MGLTEVKNELKKLDKKELINLISDLYKKNKSVKEFLDFYANPNERVLHEKYKDKIFESFYPLRGDKLKLKEAKQAISDFKKIGGSPELIADLMLFYVETGVQYTIDFGDINEAFYLSIEKTYHAALTLMEKENILEKFLKRVSNVVADSANIGWGFHDYLADTFSEFYPDYFGESE
jgi:hypothetical protein